MDSLHLKHCLKEGIMKSQIIIATHKQYLMPSDPVYVPLQVGAEGKPDIGYVRDNTGENISFKNSQFCELTGLYWAWKNLCCDYIGLAHYRRHFTLRRKMFIYKCGDSKGKRLKCVLSGEDLSRLLCHYDIIVPKKRRYYIETLYSHYGHSHYAEHLDITREIILEKYPEYLPDFDKVMKQKTGYMFNMFIMSKKLVDQYCEWLFDILFELEKRVDMPEISQFQGRFYGRVSEIIFNVWLSYQKQKYSYKVKEIGFMYMEPIKWGKKADAFLRAKFLHKKYEGSF